MGNLMWCTHLLITLISTHIIHTAPMNNKSDLAWEQGCKSLFKVGEAILGEGAYFIIFWGLMQHLAHPVKFMEGL